jgi:hypothetical protein
MMELALLRTMQGIVPVHRPALPEDEGRRERINDGSANGRCIVQRRGSFLKGVLQQVLPVQRQTLRE